MLNIDINNLNKNDFRFAHALMLTLKHNKYMNSYLSLINDDDKYYVYGFGSFYDFDTIKDACLFIIDVMSDNDKEFKSSLKYFNNVLKLEFSNNDALDYSVSKLVR